MTTAFILALIAAGGVTVVLLAAINYIRALEHDNAWLMRIIGELNEEQAKLCKERDEQRDEAERYRLLSDYAQAQVRARNVWCSNAVTPAREDDPFEDEPFEELNVGAICIDPRKKNSSVKIPSRWEDGE